VEKVPTDFTCTSKLSLRFETVRHLRCHDLSIEFALASRRVTCSGW
jgi:hypothetical protein